ncbi:MAG: type 4a pilus biogenesis protein PilO [Planctomycetota bacterium]
MLHTLACFAACAFAAVGYAVARQPLASWRATIATRANVVRAQLADGPRLRREHAELTRQLEDLSERVVEVNRRVPDTPREGEFLADLSRLAADHGVVIEDFERGATAETPTHSVVTVRLTMRASHAGLCGLVKGVAELPRITELTELEVQPDRRDDGYPVEASYALYYGMAAQPANDSPRG